MKSVQIRSFFWNEYGGLQCEEKNTWSFSKDSNKNNVKSVQIYQKSNLNYIDRVSLLLLWTFFQSYLMFLYLILNKQIQTRMLLHMKKILSKALIIFYFNSVRCSGREILFGLTYLNENYSSEALATLT